MKKQQSRQRRKTEYDKDLQQIIFAAIIKANERIKDEENNKVKEEIREWQEKIGYKEAAGKNWFEKVKNNIINSASCIFKIAFGLKEKDIKGTNISFALIKYVLEAILWCGMLVIVLFALVFLSYSIRLVSGSSIIGGILIVCFILVTMFLLLVVWAALRTAKKEIKTTTDKNFIWGVVATFAMIAAIISIILDIVQLIEQHL